MPIVDNQKLYDKVKKEANQKYEKPSAYKSGFIQKRYKELGGTYTDDNKPKKLERWFDEKWEDVGGMEYPTYRPTVRISKETPLLPDEIEPENLLLQSILKQIIKGKKNLPPFKEK